MAQEYPFYSRFDAAELEEIPHFSRMSLAILGSNCLYSVLYWWNHSQNKMEQLKKGRFEPSNFDIVHNFRITAFSFTRSVFEKPESISIYIGFETGVIVEYFPQQEKIIKYYNQDKSKPIIKSPILALSRKLGFGSGEERLLALNGDSLLIEFNVEWTASDEKIEAKLEKMTKSKIPGNSFQKTSCLYLNGFVGPSNPKIKTGVFYCLFEEKNKKMNEVPKNSPSSSSRINLNPKCQVMIKGLYKFATSEINGFCVTTVKSEELVVATSDHGLAHIFNLKTRNHLAVIQADFGALRYPTIQPDFPQFVTLCGEDDCGYVVNLETRKALKLEGHSSWVTGIGIQSFTDIFQAAKQRKNKGKDEPKERFEEVRIFSLGLDNLMLVHEVSLSEADLASESPIGDELIDLGSPSMKVLSEKGLYEKGKPTIERLPQQKTFAYNEGIGRTIFLKDTLLVSAVQGNVELFFFTHNLAVNKKNNVSVDSIPDERSPPLMSPKKT